jgi:hypothetical protein
MLPYRLLKKRHLRMLQRKREQRTQRFAIGVTLALAVITTILVHYYPIVIR